MNLSRILLLSGILVVTVVVLGGCTNPPAAGPPSSAHEAGIDALLARYVAAIKERDTAAIASMHTEPVELTDPTGTRLYTRTELTALFDAMYSVVTTVYDASVKDVTITVSGNTAEVHFIGVQDVYNAALGQRVVTEVPTHWTLQKIGDHWYIAKTRSF